MKRLSATADPEIADRLGMLPNVLSDLRPRLEEEGFAILVYEDVRIADDFLRSVRDLDDDPSDASIIREALRCYFHVMSEMQKVAALDAGYSVLAADTERTDVLRATTNRAASAWTDEP